MSVEASVAKSIAQDLTAAVRKVDSPGFSHVRVEEIVDLTLRREAGSVQSLERASALSNELRWVWRITPKESGPLLVQVIVKVKMHLPVKGVVTKEFVALQKKIAVSRDWAGVFVSFIKRLCG